MFCKKFRIFFKKIIGKITDNHVEYSRLALTVTTRLKMFLESGIAVKITDLIPSDIDNELRIKLIKALEVALRWLSVFSINDDFLQNGDQVKNSMLHKTASLMVSVLDENNTKKLKQSEYDLIVQGVYNSEFS